MALVAYDYDSTSENEEEINDVNTLANTNKELIKPMSEQDDTSLRGEISDTINNTQIKENTLFSILPQAKMVTELNEDKIEDFVPKSEAGFKEKSKIKILIPSLSQFSDDDEPKTKKNKPSAKGTGLMSLLPPVKGSIKTAKSFVPNVVVNKTKTVNSTSKNNSTSITNLVPNSVKKFVIKQQTKTDNSLSDSESDDDVKIPETFDDEMWEKVCGKPKQKPIIQKFEQSGQEIIDIAPEPEKPYEGLDNKAFKELVGKTKRPVGNIKLIDINEEEILPEKDVWMAKSLTDPEMAPKPQIEDPVDPTRRKKHHITYLAQQAKANEQELQNAWASSKNNRLASRAKYGF